MKIPGGSMPSLVRVSGSSYHSVRNFGDAGSDTTNAGINSIIIYPWRAASDISPELGGSYNFSPSLEQVTFDNPAISASISGISNWGAGKRSWRRHNPVTWEYAGDIYNIPNVFAARPGFAGNSDTNWMPYFYATDAVDLGGSCSGTLIDRSLTDEELQAITLEFTVNMDDLMFDGDGNAKFFYGVDIHDCDRGGTSYKMNEGFGYITLAPYIPPTEVWVDDEGDCEDEPCFDTIQEGIDIVASGGTVNVAAGTYEEEVVINKSLNLIGEDKTTTIIDGNDDGNAITITAPDVTLTGFTVTGGYANGGNIWDPYGGIVIDGNDGTSALTNIVIDNNIIDGNDGNGIYISAAGDGGSADNIKITNCVISNNGGSTSYFGSVTLTYGKFSGTDDTCNGPELEPYDEWRRPKNVLIEGNDLSNDISTGYVYGIYVNAGKDNTIRFNEIHGFSSKGLLMASSMPCAVIPTEYTTVENNKIYNNARNGIKLVSWNQYNTITGNNIYNNGFGYPGSDAFWMYGIQFKDGNDNTIEDNTITGNALGGLYLWGFGDSSYTWYSTTNNVITGNTISDHTETGGHGIYIPSLVRPDALGKAWPEGYDNSGFLNSNINNNTITNNLEYGIENADTSQTIDATDNWWGTISANEIATMISDNVDFAPWLDAAYPEGKSFAPVHNIDTDEWFLTIQEAIDDSDTDAGDKINVAAGTYNESINITKPLTLNGAKAGEDARTRNTGSGESILDGAGFTTAQYSLIMIANGVSNVVIDGFEFKNILLTSTGGGVGNAISSYCKSSSTADADNITIKNNYMHDLGYNGILVVSENTTGTSMIVQTGWVIQYNKIAGYRYAGVELTNVANSKVKNNDIAAPTSLFVDPGDAGVGIEIAARSRSKPVTAGTNVEVSGNKITGTFPTGSRAAINLLSRAYSTTSDATLSGVTVSGNIISGAVNTRAAILAVSESRLNGPATINALAIANNILNGNLNAIEIQDYVNGGSGTATHSSVTITGNEIKNSTGIGLYLPTFTSATGITVSSNKFLTNALGIKNEGTGALKAEKNYWGVSTPDFDTVVVGDVDYDPWYTNAAKTALSDATYTDATYTSDTSGQADLPEDVTEVTLDDDTVLDVSGGMNTAIGNDIVVGGATLSLNSFTSGNITNTDLSTPQTIGGQSVKVEKAVKLTSGTAGQPITISNAGLANIKVDIPDATTILAPSGWDGKITPPKTGSKTGTAPSGFSVGDTVVEVGSEAGVLLFDKPVKVTLTGVTGEVAYRPTGSNTWQKITTVCDSATDPTNISFPGECYKIVGSDTIIFTYHFTAFASLAPTPAAPVSGGGIPLWLLQQQQQQAKPVAPKVEVAPIAPAPVTPATPVPTPQVLGEKIYGDGTLLRGSDKKIFVITDGQKKHIPNLKELAKYAGQKICDVENTVLIQYPEVLGIKVFADGMLIRGADAKVYVIKQGKKQYVKNLEELRANYFGKKIYDVSDETLAKY